MKFSFSSVVASFLLVILNQAFAATVTISVADGAGEGFNDPTLGASRLALFQHAASILEPQLSSDVDIIVSAKFDPLFCDFSSATLGQGGPTNIAYDFAEAESTDLIYPLALANALHGSDLSPGVADIDVTFNSNIDSGACLGGNTWYYGFDAPPAGKVDLLSVVLHELLHGLGFISYVNSAGERPYYQWVDGFGNVIETVYLDDVFSANLKQDGGTVWTDLDGKNDNSGDATRSSAMRSDALVWTGTNVNAALSGVTDGTLNGQARMYSPASYENGSSVSHFDTRLSPNELMEPVHTGFTTDIGLAYEALLDIGWPVLNDRPVINSQNALTTNEETDLTLTLADFNVTDTDHTYPTGFTLTVNSGSNYSVSGTTITPATDFDGTLTVPVTVNDGVDDSATFNASVTVTNINDKPVIASQNAIATNEDNARLLAVSDFNITDPDDSSFTLSVSTGANYSVSGNTVTPNANFNGTLTVPVTVSDGSLTSDSFNASVTVNAVNDAPSITGLPTVSVDEDDSVTLTVGQFTVSDVDDASFTLSLENGSNYTLIGNTIHPVANFNGTLNVGVHVNDGDVDSASQTLNVTVNAVNDAPVISGSPSTSVVLPNSYSATFSTTDVDDSSFTYSVTSNHSWLSINASGVLSGTPTAGDLGGESVTVTVSDGTLTDTQTFTLTVMDANSADLSATMTASNAIPNTNENTTITTTVENHGPKASADGTLLVDVSGATQIVSVDAACTLASATQMQCDFTGIATTDSFDLVVTSATAQTEEITASVTGVATDPTASNDDAAISIITVASVETLQPTASGSASANANAIAFANLDGDNRSDVVMANDASTSEQWFQLNNTFTSMSLDSSFATNADARDIAVADFDKNGELDVVFVNDGVNHVYFNNNGFGAAVTVGNDDSNAVVIVDINNDTFSDVIVANNGANQVYLNDQAGGFIASQSFGSANSSDIAVIDYNLDTYPDVIVTNRDDDDFVYLNNGADQSSGEFNLTAVVIGTHLTDSRSVAVADIDGDTVVDDFVIGRMLHASASSLEWYSVAAMVASSQGSFDAGDVLSVAVGDVDGNTEHDILAVNTQGVLQVYSQESSALSLSHAETFVGATSIHASEMNGDATTDFAVTRHAGETTLLFISDNPIMTPEPTPAAAPAPAPEPEPEVQTETTVVVVQTGGSFGGFALLLALGLWARRRLH